MNKSLRKQEQKDFGWDDVVHKRARALNITPGEVFARAYVDAGLQRSTSNEPFRLYTNGGGKTELPKHVQEFCRKPLPRCSNPDCPRPKEPARFTRTLTNGRTAYFCSSQCLDVTPNSALEEKVGVNNANEGLLILERVRTAMSSAEYVKVPPHLIRRMESQPRVYFNEDRMAKLADSLREVGQMTPGTIRRIPKDDNGCEYELLDGERRLIAAKRAKLSEYRAMLVEIDAEAAPYVVSVIANFNREGHTVLEEADAVRTMYEGLKLSTAQIGKIIGRHPVDVSNLYGLRRLVPEVRDMLDPNLVKGHPLPKTAAIQIASQPPSMQLEYAQKLMNKELTVTNLREHIVERSNASGIIVRTRVRGPEERRRMFVSRTRDLDSMSKLLLLLLQEDETPEALSAMRLSQLDEMFTRLKILEERATSMLKIVDNVREAVVTENEMA